MKNGLLEVNEFMDKLEMIIVALLAIGVLTFSLLAYYVCQCFNEIFRK